MMPPLLPYSQQSELLLRLTTHQAPPFLYQYRAPGKFTENVFKDLELFFASPLIFNDPFDCQLEIDLAATPDEINSYVEKVNRNPLRSQKLRVETVLEDPNWGNDMRIAARNVMSRMGICCLTTRSNNLLMWAHYADKHTGLCLEFEVIQDLDFFKSMQPVFYRTEYPLYNPIKNMWTSGTGEGQFYLAKSKEWEYEGEYRLSISNGIGLHKFAAEALVGVTFGCKADDKFIGDIRALAQASGLHHIVYRKAVISKSRFELNFFRLP